MAIVQTALYRVRQGKNQQFLLDVTVAKKILERLGARVRVLNQVIGILYFFSSFVQQKAL